MRTPAHRPPVAVVAALLLFLGLTAGAWSARPAGSVAEPSAERSGSVAMKTAAARAAAGKQLPPQDAWSGYAFDACRAPSQRVMDRWLHTSPFVGVGIYLGGIHRACDQEHLSREWISRQRAAGWQLLPIWVGPQAACTGYDHRIVNRPEGGYAAARSGGVRQARLAAAAARRLGVERGQTVFYDIEPFPTDRLWCRMSALTFLDAWTREIRRQGYRSGVYSHVRAGISLLSRADRRFAQPDAVWYAWIDRAGSLPGEYVANPDFMRTSRVHQFVLDTRVRFGGISMDIDWNLVRLGDTAHRSARTGCPAASRVRHETLGLGDRGPGVRAAQCLLETVERHPGPTDGQYDARTAVAVHTFQAAKGLDSTGIVDRETWTALLALGHRPVLKKGSAGEPVRRLQRSLNAALRRKADLTVDGTFGPATQAAVRRYQRHVGQPATGHVTARTWRAFGQGLVATAETAPDRDGHRSKRDDHRAKRDRKGKDDAGKGNRKDRKDDKARKAGKKKDGNRHDGKRDRSRDRSGGQGKDRHDAGHRPKRDRDRSGDRTRDRQRDGDRKRDGRRHRDH